MRVVIDSVSVSELLGFITPWNSISIREFHIDEGESLDVMQGYNRCYHFGEIHQHEYGVDKTSAGRTRIQTHYNGFLAKGRNSAQQIAASKMTGPVVPGVDCCSN